ncbi:hypothetical protein OTU49_008486, partial [Cherax quadricarinatus]
QHPFTQLESSAQREMIYCPKKRWQQADRQSQLTISSAFGKTQEGQQGKAALHDPTKYLQRTEKQSQMGDDDVHILYCKSKTRSDKGQSGKSLQQNSSQILNSFQLQYFSPEQERSLQTMDRESSFAAAPAEDQNVGPGEHRLQVERITEMLQEREKELSCKQVGKHSLFKPKKKRSQGKFARLLASDDDDNNNAYEQAQATFRTYSSPKSSASTNTAPTETVSSLTVAELPLHTREYRFGQRPQNRDATSQLSVPVSPNTSSVRTSALVSHSDEHSINSISCPVSQPSNSVVAVHQPNDTFREGNATNSSEPLTHPTKPPSCTSKQVVEHSVDVTTSKSAGKYNTYSTLEFTYSHSELSPDIPQVLPDLPEPTRSVQNSTLLPETKMTTVPVSPGLPEAGNTIHTKDSSSLSPMQDSEIRNFPESTQKKDPNIHSSVMEDESSRIESTSMQTQAPQSLLTSLTLFPLSQCSNGSPSAESCPSSEANKSAREKLQDFQDLHVIENKQIPCLLCGITVIGKEVLDHLLFGQIRCAACNLSIKTCAEFQNKSVLKTPCSKEAMGKHRKFLWSSNLIDFVSYHMRKRLTGTVFKEGKESPSTTDVVEAMADFLTSISVLEDRNPWSDGICKCWKYVRNMQSTSDLTSREKPKRSLRDDEDVPSENGTNRVDIEDIDIRTSPVLWKIASIKSLARSEETNIERDDAGANTLREEPLSVANKNSEAFGSEEENLFNLASDTLADLAESEVPSGEIPADLTNKNNEVFGNEEENLFNLVSDTLTHLAESEIPLDEISLTNAKKSNETDQTLLVPKSQNVPASTSDQTTDNTIIPWSMELVSSFMESESRDNLAFLTYDKETLELVMKFLPQGDNVEKGTNKNHINLVTDCLSQVLATFTPSETEISSECLSNKQKSSDTNEPQTGSSRILDPDLQPCSPTRTVEESPCTTQQLTLTNSEIQNKPRKRKYIPMPKSKRRLLYTDAESTGKAPTEVLSKPETEDNYVLYSYPSRPCAEECVQCYTALHGSMVTFNPKTFVTKIDCPNCGLISYSAQDPIHGSSPYFKGKSTKLQKPGPKSKKMIYEPS